MRKLLPVRELTEPVEETLRNKAIESATQARISELYQIYKLRADLEAYLYEKHGVGFVEHHGKFALAVVRGEKLGIILARAATFAEMMDIALARKIDE